MTESSAASPSTDAIPTLTETITDMPAWLSTEDAKEGIPEGSITASHAEEDSAISSGGFEQALAALQASIGPATGMDALGGDWRWQLLQAQLPGLFEQALIRVKPQLLQAFGEVLAEALQASRDKQNSSVG